MTVDPGTAIRVSDRFCRIFFDMQSAPHAYSDSDSELTVRQVL